MQAGEEFGTTGSKIGCDGVAMFPKCSEAGGNVAIDPQGRDGGQKIRRFFAGFSMPAARSAATLDYREAGSTILVGAFSTTAESMDSAKSYRELPPLILHPFDHRRDSNGRSRVVADAPLRESSLRARYDELCMLCLIGQDLNRWLAQCLEAVSEDSEFAGLSECDFIAVLLFAPPTHVLQKMHAWGVRNFQLLFSRAIGLNAVFPDPPSANKVTDAFLRDFHRYADALYDVRLKSEDAAVVLEDVFTFEIYASGEYLSHLETSWTD